MTEKTVAELAAICGATLEGDGGRLVVGPAALGEAGPDQVSFLDNPRYVAELESTRAAAVVLAPDVRTGRRDLALLRTPEPNRAFTRIVTAFQPAPERPPLGVHPSAVVAGEAEVSPEASVGPRCVIEAGASVAAGAILHAGACVRAGASVGAETVLHPGVVLYPGVRIGRRCTIHAGAVIGSDGFGFEPTAEGWEKIPQCGSVVVEDDVEIGANTTIDRGRFDATRIGRGAKLDNLVHIAHNVHVGEGAILVAQVGVAGSSRIGKRAMLGGQVGVSGHVDIGDGARVSAQSGIGKDLPGGRDYFGSPARPHREALRTLAAMGRVPELARRLEQLEEAVRKIEAGGTKP